MRVIISGGGTAGHIYPGLALAKALRKIKPNIEILYVGTKDGLEASLVPKEGIPFLTIDLKGLPRKISLKAFQAIFLAGKGSFEARKIIKDFKPDVVIGMGAYVSLPVLGAAIMQKIPTAIHEQNAVPGLVNRFLARFVDLVAISFPDIENTFSTPKKVVFTGNPIREDILAVNKKEAKEKFEIKDSRKVLLVFGGSRGAKKINDSVVELYDKWRDNNDLQIIHATGKINYDHVRGAIERIKSDEDLLKYSAYPFIENMGEAYSVSDLIVCRSGATTIAEITALGLPAILVPYPYATNNHQEKNARFLEQAGAGRVLLDKDINCNSLANTIDKFISDKEALNRAKEASLKIGRPQAAQDLAAAILNLLNN